MIPNYVPPSEVATFEYAAQNTANGRRLMAEALNAFIRTIESTGGLVEESDGSYAPCGDREWLDLADCYQKACQTIDRPLLIGERICRNQECLDDFESTHPDQMYCSEDCRLADGGDPD